MHIRLYNILFHTNLIRFLTYIRFANNKQDQMAVKKAFIVFLHLQHSGFPALFFFASVYIQSSFTHRSLLQ